MAGFNWSNYATGGATRKDAFSGTNPSFAAALQNMFSSAPPNIQRSMQVYSAYRSPETQAGLYSKALSKYGSEQAARVHVAPPGKSQHNLGMAADLGYMSPAAKSWVHDNAAKYGLSFPMSYEPWHVELATARTKPVAAVASSVPRETVPPGLLARAPLTGTQAQQTTGIMGVINPATVGPVERRALAPPTTTASMFGPMTPAQSMKSQLDSYHTGIAATQAALANQNYDPSMQARLTQQDMDFANTGINPSTPAGLAAKNALRTGLLAQTDNYNQSVAQQPATTAYQETPSVAAPASMQTQVHVSQPTSGLLSSQEQSLRGLMSPQEYGAYQTNKASLDAAAPNHSINMAHVGQMAQKGLGAIAGGLLGGLTLGPIGGLLGGYIGKQIASPNGLMGNNNFPTKPDSTPKGDGGLTAAGQAAMHNSPQFGRAMAAGGVGLY